MIGPVSEQREKKAEEYKRESVHDQLTELSSWEADEEQTLEEGRQEQRESMISGQLEENTAMQAQAQEQLTRANAAAAAPGTPLQEQAPAKQTYKERRERARKAKAARRRCPAAAGADTYDCAEATARIMRERKNSLNFVRDLRGVDRQMVGAFCQGYRVNKRGKHATMDEGVKAVEDETMIRGLFMHKEPYLREPHLKRFHKELMDFPLRADTVSDAYIVQNVDQLQRILDKSYYFKNLMEDPDNKPYFDSLTPMERELLAAKQEVMDHLRTYFIKYLSGLGVNTDAGGYLGADHQAQVIELRRIAASERKAVTAEMGGWEQKRREILLGRQGGEPPQA